MVILPSSIQVLNFELLIKHIYGCQVQTYHYVGILEGPRYMREKTRYGLSYVRKFETPHFFIDLEFGGWG